jgi:catechol 2,3-dioxygenase-like lactoylglutathione lyase family enzyme
VIDHLGVIVRSFDASMQFYTAALVPLGYGIVVEQAGRAAFGPPGKPLFWISTGESAAKTALHIAFAAQDRKAVTAFHAAAMKAGATDNGLPGPRPDYHANYFGAFVIDPDGNNIEAVCHDPQIEIGV